MMVEQNSPSNTAIVEIDIAHGISRANREGDIRKVSDHGLVNLAMNNAGNQ